jgi:pimeloyl-ACP methyl ester carboxylesterase
MKRSEIVLGRSRWMWISVAIVLMLISWWSVLRLDDGLVVHRFNQDGVPLRYIRPSEGRDIPGVIIAHGFGGSQQIMLGYGYSLARAGFGVMILDFTGHGSNPNPRLNSSYELQSDLYAAYLGLTSQPEIDVQKIALLGHSMGSGAVLRAGIDQPDRYKAVIAISPTSADVSITLPSNLMLQAGALEGRFVSNAKRLLTQAGGPNADFKAGLARRFEMIPNVEHISILFSKTSQGLAREWLEDSFGVESTTDFSDTRIIWYGLHQIAWIILLGAVGPLITLKLDIIPVQPKNVRRWLGFILAPFIALGIFKLLSTRMILSTFLGFHVGGALALFLAIWGIVWLALAVRPKRLRWQSVLYGGLLFILLWAVPGLMAQYTWMQWFLVTPRLMRWPLLVLACLPLKLAAGHALYGTRGWRRAGEWAIQSVMLVTTMVLMAQWVPGMYIVVLMAPVLPFVLALEILISRYLDDPWVYAIGSALFFGWMLAAFFPIA